MDAQKQKCMILCVAGQSNAVGYDESLIPADYLNRFRTGRIAQLGMYGDDNCKIIPLGACAQNYQDLRPYSNPANPQPNLGTKGIHLPLADLLLGSIPDDYNILVIACAYGGTAFTQGEPGSYDKEHLRPSPGPLRWGEGMPYYQAMRDRIAYALDQDPENRFLGMVWIQGENDLNDAAGHAAGFDRMADAFFADFRQNYPGRVYRGDWDRGVWYNVETVAYWYTRGQCPQIWEHYKAWNPETYVPVPRDTDSNEVNGTGLTASNRADHYGNDAYYKVVAPCAARVMEKRLKKEK